MPLQIIGAGFGRTGTWSTYLALDRLGFPCYHMKEVILNKANASHLGFWCRVATAPPGTAHDWERVFAKYTATVDNPGCCVWRELLCAYPDAKVLLTLHPKGADAWYESTIETIYFTERLWQWKVLEWLTPFAHKFGKMSRRLIWRRSLQGTMPDRARAIARYQAHIDEVKAAVPAERLLILRVTDGWGPLCAFLGVPEPAETFPNANDRASIQKTIGGVIRGGYAMLAASVGAIAAVVFGAYLLLR